MLKGLNGVPSCKVIMMTIRLPIAGLLAICIIWLPSCTQQPSFDEMLGTAYESKCAQSTPCRINVSDVVGFAWDTLLVANYLVPNDSLSVILHTPVVRKESYSSVLAFKHAGRLIFMEEHSNDFSSIPEGHAVIDISGNYALFTPSNAVFTVRSEQRPEGGSYYMLRP